MQVQNQHLASLARRMPPVPGGTHELRQAQGARLHLVVCDAVLAAQLAVQVAPDHHAVVPAGCERTISNRSSM
jgi:hypothetical protein